MPVDATLSAAFGFDRIGKAAEQVGFADQFGPAARRAVLTALLDDQAELTRSILSEEMSVASADASISQWREKHRKRVSAALARYDAERRAWAVVRSAAPAPRPSRWRRRAPRRASRSSALDLSRKPRAGEASGGEDSIVRAYSDVGEGEASSEADGEADTAADADADGSTENDGAGTDGRGTGVGSGMKRDGMARTESTRISTNATAFGRKSSTDRHISVSAAPMSPM